jgi:hypothetical protein
MTLRSLARLPFALTLLLALPALAAAPKPAAKAPAKGGSFFRLDKHKSTFSHACGFRVKDGARGEIQRIVILSSVPVDCAAADAELDPKKELEGAIVAKNGAYASLTVSADGQRIEGGWVSTEPSDAFSFGGQGVIEIQKSDDSRLEGRYYTPHPEPFFDKTFEFDLPFAVDLLSGSLSGTPLPKGGGEPGKIYEAYRKAVAKDDEAGLKKVVTKERAAQLEEWASGGAFKEVFQGQKTLELKTGTVTGGLLKENRAILDVEGKNYDGTKVRGQVFLLREDGAWKVSEGRLQPVFD